MSVYDNMAFALKLRAKTGRLRKMFTAVFNRGAYKRIKAEEKDIDDRVQKAASILGIQQLLPRKPRQLSGGQRQRVAVGRAIVREPKVFLFDEPLSNLDAKLRVQTRAEITKLHQQLATTFIYVTHDQTEAMTMGTRIAVMKDGLLQQVDSPQKLYDHPDNMFVAGFIGSPSMNFFDVTIKGTGDNVEVEGDGFKLPIPAERAQGLKNVRRQAGVHGHPARGPLRRRLRRAQHSPRQHRRPGGSDRVDGQRGVPVSVDRRAFVRRPRRPAQQGARWATTCAWWRIWTTCTSSRRTRPTIAPCAKPATDPHETLDLTRVSCCLPI